MRGSVHTEQLQRSDSMPVATLSSQRPSMCAAAEQGTQQSNVAVRNRLSHTSTAGLCTTQRQLGQYLTSRGARVVQLTTTGANIVILTVK